MYRCGDKQRRKYRKRKYEHKKRYFTEAFYFARRFTPSVFCQFITFRESFKSST
jgi:hypothetical protein